MENYEVLGEYLGIADMERLHLWSDDSITVDAEDMLDYYAVPYGDDEIDGYSVVAHYTASDGNKYTIYSNGGESA